MLVFVLTLLLSPQAAALPSGPLADVALARTTVERLANGEFAAAEATFSEKLRAALPEDKLRLMWQKVAGNAGQLKLIGDPQFKDRPPLRGVILPVQFDNRKIKIEVVLNAAGEIAGLLFT